ncbi:MAG: UDP-N-acetylmuramoyl-L-alanine--D-glutamate ligase [Bacteroidales bacterium]|nr:UDP-N-acetylmuramoyl-L-alanine--D-glutamate ligase [Bacteroidales bacterium]
MNEETLIVILGAGESGTGAAVLAKKNGFQVFVSEKGKIKDKYKKVLLHNGIEFEEGSHDEARILSAKQIIKSPGIPDTIPLIIKAQKAGIAIISEIEFASRYTSAKLICITGSNGKTTTSLLTYHILKQAGLNVGLAGNVGKSFAGLVAEREYDVFVLEISSFQLDGMFEFKADIAILMNITPDHLDRYDYDMKKYVDSKFRIIRNQTADDYFIFCADDPIIEKEMKEREIFSQKIPFSLEKKCDFGACSYDDKLIINDNKDILIMTLEELALQGKHNVYNSMAAGIGSRLMDVRKNNIKQCLSDFQNVEHRLENVGSVHGIEFINDSKATNVNSTWYAMESMRNKIVWVAGGVDKGNDYTKLIPLIREKVKAIICLGEDNSKLIEAFSGMVDEMYETQSVDAAVEKAYQIAKSGETVLLSPACASFDLFESYEERGNQFKLAVKKL